MEQQLNRNDEDDESNDDEYEGKTDLIVYQYVEYAMDNDEVDAVDFAIAET